MAILHSMADYNADTIEHRLTELRAQLSDVNQAIAQLQRLALLQGYGRKDLIARKPAAR